MRLSKANIINMIVVYDSESARNILRKCRWQRKMIQPRQNGGLPRASLEGCNRSHHQGM